MNNIKSFVEYINEDSSDKYAGQRKVSANIDKKIKKSEAESEETKKKRDEKRKLFYYNKLRLKNQSPTNKDNTTE